MAKIVKKQLAGVQDLLVGVGEVKQRRLDENLLIKRINVTELGGALVVDSVATMQLLDPQQLNEKTVIVKDNSAIYHYDDGAWRTTTDTIYTMGDMDFMNIPAGISVVLIKSSAGGIFTASSMAVPDGSDNFEGRDGITWVRHQMGLISQDLGGSTTRSISQLAITNALAQQKAELEQQIGQKVDIGEIPSNLVMYFTDVAATTPNHNKLVTEVTDPDYPTNEVEILTDEVDGGEKLLAKFITRPGVMFGDLHNVTSNIIGQIKRVSGDDPARFFYKLLKNGNELMATSAMSDPVSSGSYVELSLNSVIYEANLLDTDEIVVEFYGVKTTGSSSSVYSMVMGGDSSPIRATISAPTNSLQIIKVTQETGDNKAIVMSQDAVTSLVGREGIGNRSQLFTSSGTFTVPDRVTKVKVTIMGAGGNGARSGNGPGTSSWMDPQGYGGAGGNGGNGVLGFNYFSVSSGQAISVVIAGPGSKTSFGDLCNAGSGGNGSAGGDGENGRGSGGGEGGMATWDATIGANGANGANGNLVNLLAISLSPGGNSHGAGGAGGGRRIDKGTNPGKPGKPGYVLVEW